MDKYPKLEEFIGGNDIIKVVVSPSYVTEQSKPERNLYTYSYLIQLENIGNTSVKLLNRHWEVYAGGRKYQDIKGEGVIGQQPELDPRSTFQYQSFVVVDNPVSSMKGIYTFIDTNGEFFDLVIPQFDLIYIKDKHIN